MKLSYETLLKEEEQNGLNHPLANRTRRYPLDGGAVLLVGKNAEQNDALSFQIARPTDIWLHASGIPGSHGVIICNSNCSEIALQRAAEIVAFHSKGRGMEKVPVVYCQARHLSKPEGARLGSVNLAERNIIEVSPKE